MTPPTDWENMFDELAHAFYEPGDKDYWDAITFGKSFIRQEREKVHLEGFEEGLKAKNTILLTQVEEMIGENENMVESLLGKPKRGRPRKLYVIEKESILRGKEWSIDVLARNDFRQELLTKLAALKKGEV